MVKGLAIPDRVDSAKESSDVKEASCSDHQRVPFGLNVFDLIFSITNTTIIDCTLNITITHYLRKDIINRYI
jgi:hypothetical protein